MIEERKHLGSGGEVTAANFNAEYWDRRYTPRAAMVPNFIRMSQGLELKILTTGKYLNVIREVNKYMIYSSTGLLFQLAYLLTTFRYVFSPPILPSFLPSFISVVTTFTSRLRDSATPPPPPLYTDADTAMMRAILRRWGML